MTYSSLKRMVIGAPFPSSAELHERLDKVRALAVFASDPISSNAYATESIMAVLILMGSGALSLTMPIAIGIGLLIMLVIFSYIQTILHYPGGGGAYTGRATHMADIVPWLIDRRPSRVRARIRGGTKTRIDSGGFIELQGTAEGHAFRRDELDALLGLAERGIAELFAAQRAALAG